MIVYEVTLEFHTKLFRTQLVRTVQNMADVVILQRPNIQERNGFRFVSYRSINLTTAEGMISEVASEKAAHANTAAGER